MQDGTTALMLASKRNHAEIVQCLIDAKANLNVQSKEVSIDNRFKFKTNYHFIILNFGFSYQFSDKSQELLFLLYPV